MHHGRYSECIAGRLNGHPGIQKQYPATVRRQRQCRVTAQIALNGCGETDRPPTKRGTNNESDSNQHELPTKHSTDSRKESESTPSTPSTKSTKSNILGVRFHPPGRSRSR